MSSIIVFGGTRGIGKIIAEYLITERHVVTVASRNPKSLGKFLNDIAKKKLRANAIQVNITNEQDVTKAFKSHEAKWHSSPDVVINCAGVQGPIGSSWVVPVKNWEETIKINLIGAYIVAKTAIQRMMKKGYGSIIMFSGGGAAYGRPNFSAYAVSKTGILRMVEIMADELKEAGYPNIIINAIAPGAVKTNMTDEILKAGSRAGKKALEEARGVYKTGGTPAKKIIDLVNFLIDIKTNAGLSGRLIHVHEDYKRLIKKYGSDVPGDIGKIRRISIVEQK